MYQGTTPSIILEIEGMDLSDATVYVSFKRGNEVLTKSDVTVTYDSEEQISAIACPLTQEETLGFRAGTVQVQVRFIYEDGQAYATDKAEITVDNVIYPEVIEYVGGEGE